MVKTNIGGNKSLASDRIDLIFAYLNRDKYVFNDESSLFWKTLTMVLYHTGMRISKLLNLTSDDIFIESGWTIMRAKYSKNYLEYKIPISNDLSSCLLEYKNKFNPKKGRFFNSLYYKVYPKKHRLSRVTTTCEVFNFYKKLSDALGFRVTTHMFRHTLATDIIRKIGNVVFAQKMPGHLCLNSTAKYTHANINDLKMMMNELERDN